MLVILPLAAVVVAWAMSRRPGFQPLPEPNGYDLLVQAASQSSQVPTDCEQLPDDELARLVEVNKAALQITREGLRLPSAVPVSYGQAWIAQQVPALMSLKRLARLLEAEAILQSRRGDTNGALQSCLDLVRYGRAIASEGVQINFLVGSACELMGACRMTNLLAGATTEQCRSACQGLEGLERTREPKAAIERREHAWQRGSLSIVDEVKLIIQTRSLRPETGWEFLVPQSAYEDRVQQMRLALLRIATRGYELETGRTPAAASDVVPRYLSAVPIDPETSKPVNLDDKPRSCSPLD